MLISIKGMNKWTGCLALILCLLVIPTINSYGQKKEYPEREIKILVGTTPGGVSDLYTRAWSDEFGKILKVPVIVVNEAGASGMAALIEGATARPDGYTLTYISQSNVVGYAISTKPGFDLFKDFVPLGAFGSFPTLVVVEQSSPFITFEDMIEYAKKNPGKLKCGSAGATIISHFNFELLKQYTKVNIVMVPFKGSPPAVTALLGKHVDLLSLSPSALIGLLQAGRVRALLTSQRLKDYPKVPLFSEKGLTEAGLSAWSGLFAQSAVPNEIIKKLTDSFEKIAKDPNIIGRIDKLGFTADYQNPTQLGMTLKKDFEKISAVAKAAGISE